MIKPTLIINTSPNGFSYVKYGLKDFNFQAMYEDQPKLYQGCKPFTASCKLILYILVCLTNTPITVNDEENKNMNDFKNMEKSIPSVRNFFNKLQKNIEGCSVAYKELDSIQEPHRREFYEASQATFATKISILSNKVMILGALFRKDIGNIEFMLQCSVLKSPINRNDFIDCHETKKIVVNSKLSYLQFWNIWARINCLKFAKYHDCGPICVASTKCVCNEAEEEVCINQYVKVNTDVSYFNGERRILLRTEKRCSFLNNCLQHKCSNSNTCITLESGKGKCENVALKITFSNGSHISQNRYFKIGTKLTCAYSFDTNFQESLRRYNFQHNFYWKVIRTSIKYGLVVNKNSLTLSHEKFYKAQKEKLYVDVKCVFNMSSSIPNYETTLTFTLIKPPTKLTIESINGLVFTNQNVKCLSDAYPKTNLLFEYKVESHNFLPDIGFQPYLHIPQDAKIGLLILMVRAKLTMDNDSWLSDFSKFTLTLIHLKNLSWGSENKIIYPPTIISCTATLYLIHEVIVTQLNGPSMLFPLNKSSFKIETNNQGGLYRVLCTYLIDRDMQIIYNRIYKFNIYKYPINACISLILGYNHIYFICLHNGFPKDLAATQIILSKYLRGNSLQNQHYKSNKIKIIYEAKDYKYKLKCMTSYDNHLYNLSVQFYIIQSSGLSVKSTDVQKHKCDDITMNEYAQVSSNNYWIEKYKFLSFHEFRIFISFVFLSLVLVLLFFLLHVYSYDKYVAINLTTNSLSRRHCIMRLNNKMIELAVFRVKNAGSLRLTPLRKKFEAYRKKTQEDLEDDDEKFFTTKKK